MKLAVLIDAENISQRYIKDILDEISKFGVPTIKRVYTDWTQSNSSGWKQVLLDHALTPVQQYRYTSGKNSTDSAMIIDAMDVLYSGKVEGFCIVSSDSDFTRLCNRLREAGMKVFGFGEKKTPKPFLASCDKFTFIEILRESRVEDGDDEKQGSSGQKDITNAGSATAANSGQGQTSSGTGKKEQPVSRQREEITTELVQFILDAVDELADDSGWAMAGEVGMLLIKKRPEFDARIYGHKKLTLLLKAIDKLELKQENYDVYVRVNQ
jgi:hypothetical protein